MVTYRTVWWQGSFELIFGPVPTHNLMKLGMEGNRQQRQSGIQTGIQHNIMRAHLHGEGLALALVVVAELVGGLAVRDLVVAEPLRDSRDLTGEVPGTGLEAGFMGLTWAPSSCKPLDYYSLNQPLGKWLCHANPKV
jgi:hypothetical protein